MAGENKHSPILSLSNPKSLFGAKRVLLLGFRSKPVVSCATRSNISESESEDKQKAAN